ncbi:ethylbenzene dehydrogenase-related protein [bacterium]|nr:ethylbenzene dehydrogenase-related protein [bacterium]
MKRVAFILLLIAIAGFAFYWFNRGPKEPPASTGEVQALFLESIPVKADDQAWQDAPRYSAQLLLQDIVDPRLMKPSTTQVKVQSITNGREVAFLMQWEDTTVNDLPVPASFADACAVQLPSTSSADLPAPQMGEEGRRVEITYWSAIWQATVNGREEDIKTIYPNSAVDHYPFQAPSLASNQAEQEAMAQRYAPARALQNAMAGPRTQP